MKPQPKQNRCTFDYKGKTCNRKCNGNMCAVHELMIQKLVHEVFGSDTDSDSDEQLESIINDISDL